ncbi:MAG: tetratricopeptide repeat protein [Acidobacteria bacterium]|nr:tetratricopeptide repeat protein [Acidobacteriota bacterium]
MRSRETETRLRFMRLAVLRGLSVLAVSPVALVSVSGADLPSRPLSSSVREADDYYLGRHMPANVRKGLQILRAAAAGNPRDYEVWWRISKLTCYLARHTEKPEKLKLLEEGVAAGKRAVQLAPRRVEGHFWLGANFGLTAETRGMLRGLFLVDDIRKEMETVVELNPDYEQAAGLRTLARVYYRAPFFKGGDKRRSIDLLEKCLTLFPENSLTMLYLADSYLALGLREEARKQLEKILALCPDPQYGPELAENQAEARARLARHFRAG